MEERLLRNVDLLIVSHQGMKENYLHKFHFLQDKIEVVYNGFDPESIGSGNNPLFPEFTILHLGDFYAKQKNRDPNLFLSALREMISEQEILPSQLRVFFIGERYPEIEKAIVSKGLSAFVSYIGRVPHDIAMEYLNKSHMLLLIETMDVMTTKVFEYLAAGKPLLCLLKKGGELEAFISRFSANSYIISSNSVNQIKEAVSNCFSNYNKGNYRSVINDKFRDNFTRMNQTRQLAEVLQKMV
jgi:glycosyltransferase involved in cell wall biosynthesis